MTNEPRTKAIVSVSEMAAMVGLSRARFYELLAAGVFPPPVYKLSNRRPVYVEELQKVCLEVRRRNCGVNGQPVLFYSRGHRPTSPPKPTSKAKSKPTSKDQHEDVLNGLRALGLVAATSAQVAAAIKELFPTGLTGVNQGEVVRAVFLHIKRRDTSGNVG